jgi:UDP-glucose 4-epimerase
VERVKVLIAGGAGFIGSTIASACLDAGVTPVIVDNLVTGRREFTEGRIFYEGDISDAALIGKVFAEHPEITAAIHCAALIVVPESVSRPIHYYRENVSKTLEFAAALIEQGCRRLVFSSSAAIYRPGEDFTVDEQSSLEPLSPYARTKAMVEQMLADVTAAHDLSVLSLRYFNPIGADPALRTGLQLPSPSHALGKIISAYESGQPFTITGTDYPTRDGTGIRDYIHVWDLAQAHLAALDRFDQVLDGAHGHRAINLGTGTGTTVRELVAAFESAAGVTLPVVEVDRRPGDTVGAYTRSSLAYDLLGWKAQMSIEQGIRDSLCWSKKRPQVLG